MDKLSGRKWSALGCRVDNSLSKKADIGVSGIELEIENPDIPEHRLQPMLDAIPNCRWSTRAEGSLRNGFEVALDRPLPRGEAELALYQVLPLFRGSVDTFRAATHLHMNVQPFTLENIMRIMIGYAVMEPLFYALAGNGRDESPFCVPWRACQGSFASVWRAYAKGNVHDLHVALRKCPKYGGMNVRAVSLYGSVEMRHLPTPAGVPDADIISRLQDYFDLCYTVYDTARSCAPAGTPFNKFVDMFLAYTGHIPEPPQVAWVYSALSSMDKIDELSDGLSVHETDQVLQLTAIDKRQLRKRRPAYARALMPDAAGGF